MKWFKHSSIASQDAKLKKLRIKYGMQGYGLYWYCLELIASEVDAEKLTFELEHDSEVLSFDTGINYQVVQEMMQYMVELGLFENTSGVITCLNLAKRADEYLVKSLKRMGKLKELENIRSVSGQSSDKVRPEERKGEERKVKESKVKPLSASQAKADALDDDINVIFDYWRKTMGKDTRAKLTAKRKSKVKARLKDGFTPREICLAIKGCSKSPHHMGDNDTGAIYDDLELICRDDAKVRMFMAINTSKSSTDDYYQQLANKEFN